MFKRLKFKQSGSNTGSVKRLSFAAAMSVLGFGFLAGSFADIDTAFVPFVVTADARVSAVSVPSNGEPIVIDVEAGVEKVLKLPVVTSSIKMRSKLNNTPFVSSARGKVSLNLPASSYKSADVALYTINGRAVMRGKVTASEAVKSISRSNVGTGVYLLSVKGTNGNNFSSRMAHKGGSLNINVEFNNGNGGALKNTSGKEIKAAAGEFDYQIMVSAPKYKDSAYTLSVVANQNPKQIITLQSAFGEFYDSRNDMTYRTIQIGNQVWMAENLNYETESGSYCYEDSDYPDDDFCETYGRLYTWSAAMDIPEKYDSELWGESGGKHQRACPAGWHLPSNQEWDSLMVAVGGSSNAGTKLKSQTGWNWNTWDDISGNGTDDYGFSALPGGNRISGGNFDYAGYHGRWWSATEYDAGNARYRYMDSRNSFVGENWYYKSNGFSVRCLRD